MSELVSNAQAELEPNQKRTDYLDWSDYFMGIALLSAQRSKDPVTQVGACIVNEDNRIVGIGYNGMPNGCDDNNLPWKKDGEWLQTKKPYVCHAELNAIFNKTSANLKNCTIFVSLFPCNECAKLIIQAGIGKVVYASDKKSDAKKYIASRNLLRVAGVNIEPFTTNKDKVVIDYTAAIGDVTHQPDTPLV